MCKMNSKKFVCAIIVGLVISLFQGPLLACASSINPKTVKVGYYENALFEEGASEDEVKTGYAYEYFMKLSEYTGWRYEYVYGSFGDLYQMLVDGDIDLLAGLAYREERADLIGYPEDSMGSETYNIIKHGDNEEITTDPTTINGHTIGVLESAVSNALEAYLISHELKADIKYFDDTEALINAFDAGEVDLLASEGAGTIFRRNYEVISTFGLSDYYVCTNIRKPELLDELNDAQNSLFNDEPYYRSALSSKYFADSVSMQAFSPIEREWLDYHDTLTIGYLNNYLPYSTSDPNGKVTGVIKDIMPALLRSLNINSINIEYVGFDNYDDMIAAVNDESIDAAFPVGGGMYYSEQNGIYQTHPLASVSTDLIYKTVVINPNFVTFAVNERNKMQSYYIKTNYPDAVLVYYGSTEECLDAVLDNKVDCTTLNGLRANEILKNGQYSGLSLRQLPAKDDRGIGVKIGNEGLLRLLNRGINILGDDYAANNAYQYVEDLYTYSLRDWFNSHYVVIIAVALAVIFIISLLFARKIRAMRYVYEGLKNSSQSQRLVIENIANSLRTPVSEIYDISKEASQVTDDEKMLKKSINKIHDASSVVLGAIDKVIDISLLDKKKMVLSQDKVNIVELIKEVEQNMLRDADKKRVSLTVLVGEITNKDIIVDKARLTQVLEIVLSNAINYTATGGSVIFSVAERKCINPTSAEFEFNVKDNGIGMSKEFQKIALEPFTKEVTNKEAIANGPGLGLAVAERLVRLMNGTVKIKSEKENGTEVTLTTLCKINYES